MSGDPCESERGRPEEAWQELDDLVEEIAKLSASEVSAPEFYAAVLDRIVPVLAAEGGAVWTEVAGSDPRLEYQVNLPDGEMPGGTDAERRHRRLLGEVLRNGKGKTVPPRSGPADGAQAGNPTGFVLLVCPWRCDEELAGVVEVFQRPGTSPSAQRGYFRFLTVVSELVAEFHRNRLLCDLRRRMERFGRFEQFVERIHSRLDLKATAYQIANEGRALVGCDRLSVSVVRGSRCRLAAVSGVDRVNRRANVVRHLERLCKAVGTVGEPLWHPDESADLAPEIGGPLEDYLDVAHVRALAVVPLRAPEEDPPAGGGQVIGTLVVEQFHGVFDDRLRATVSAVLGHSGAALGNALELESIPMVRVLRGLGKARWLVRARQLPKTVAAVAILAGAVIALATVPADFRIEVPGELQPVVRREIFAPYDGIVSEVAVEHGARVRRGETLVEIRRAELDFELKRVRGELQTAGKRLVAKIDCGRRSVGYVWLHDLIVAFQRWVLF
ncbi:MAG: GAF domain-containing protein [Planctomycetota bacterium]